MIGTKWCGNTLSIDVVKKTSTSNSNGTPVTTRERQWHIKGTKGPILRAAPIGKQDNYYMAEWGGPSAA